MAQESNGLYRILNAKIGSNITPRNELLYSCLFPVRGFVYVDDVLISGASEF